MATKQELASTLDWATEDNNWLDLDDKPPGDGWRLFQIVPLIGGRYQLIWAREVEVEPLWPTRGSQRHRSPSACRRR